MKKILIDARMVGPIPNGIGRYVTDIAAGLKDLGRSSLYECVFIVKKGQTLDQPWTDFELIESESPFLSPKEMVEIPWLLRRAKADLYHSPSFSSLPWSPCPWVVTVHDLNHLTYGSLAKKIYYETLLRRFCKKSKCLMTVSRFSQKELKGWLGFTSEQITVVPNAFKSDSIDTTSSYSNTFNSHTSDSKRANEMRSGMETLERLGLTAGKYFFCLSNPKPHKNLDFLEKAFHEYWQSTSDGWPLVLTIDPPGGPARRGGLAAGAINNQGVIAVGAINDQDAKVLSQNAGAGVYPSLYEGFGRPPLETAFKGVPVIVSAIEPHQEVFEEFAEDEVTFASPTDRGAWVRALGEASLGKLRGASKESLQKTLEKYSVRNLATRVDQVYRAVLSH